MSKNHFCSTDVLEHHTAFASFYNVLEDLLHHMLGIEKARYLMLGLEEDCHLTLDLRELLHLTWELEGFWCMEEFEHSIEGLM